MSKETYTQWMNYLKEKPRLVLWMHILNQIATASVYLCYPNLLIWCFLHRKEMLVKAILVPGISFILISLFRKWINRPRPYTQYETPSAIFKEVEGNSFPSRHIFSVFVIAGTWAAVYPSMVPAYALCGIGIVLAIVRVVSGVHYISDVVAGAVLGLLAAYIGFSL